MLLAETWLPRSSFRARESGPKSKADWRSPTVNGAVLRASFRDPNSAPESKALGFSAFVWRRGCQSGCLLSLPLGRRSPGDRRQQFRESDGEEKVGSGVRKIALFVHLRGPRFEPAIWAQNEDREIGWSHEWGPCFGRVFGTSKVTFLLSGFADLLCSVRLVFLAGLLSRGRGLFEDCWARCRCSLARARLVGLARQQDAFDSVCLSLGTKGDQQGGPRNC